MDNKQILASIFNMKDELQIFYASSKCEFPDEFRGGDELKELLDNGVFVLGYKKELDSYFERLHKEKQ